MTENPKSRYRDKLMRFDRVHERKQNIYYKVLKVI